MPTSDIGLSALDALVREAPTKRWVQHEPPLHASASSEAHGVGAFSTSDSRDTAALVAAHTALPALLAELRRLRAEVAEKDVACEHRDNTIRELSEGVIRYRAEVEMLRGVGCNEDGDGPCGACIKCARAAQATAEREADRLRHGNTIEGDFVCPNELDASIAREELNGEWYRGVRDAVAFLQRHADSLRAISSNSAGIVQGAAQQIERQLLALGRGTR